MAATGPDPDTELDEEWRFALDEVGPEAATEPEPLEPGEPSLENVFFILVGIAATLLLLSTVV